VSAVRRNIRSAEWSLYLLTALISTALAALALQLWKADFRVPLLYRGDALPTGAHFKTVIEQGWYEWQPLLGAPYGQNYHDFPTADNLHMIAARLIGFVVPDWAIAMNVYFVIGFPLAAITALWFLRRCGISRWLSVALATLYALAPYHFIRGESHLFLASYFAIPLALGLLVDVLRGQPLWGRGTAPGWRGRVFSPTVRTVLITALLATSSPYYAIFFLILLAAAGIFVLVRDRNLRRFVGAAMAGLATVGVVLINMAPDVLYSLIHGANPGSLERSPGETEFYALKLTQLLLPWPGHRIGILAELRQEYDSAYVSLGEQPALGVVAAAGFIAAFLLLAYLGIARMRAAKPVGPALSLVAGLSSLVFVAFLFSTLGGLSTIISIFTSSIRGWNRMSIVIAALCLAIVGLLIDRGIERMGRSRPRWPAVLAPVIAAVLLVVGFLDQTPGNADSEYASTVKAFDSDQEYFQSLEASLPADSMVLIVPYIPFPESSSASGALASEQLIPFLHTDHVRWSSGGIKGRPTADWPGQLEQYGEGAVAPLGAMAGFAGVLVDRAAALDHGAALEKALTDTTGQQPEVSGTGRWAYFDLEPVAGELGIPWGRATEQAPLITNPVVGYPNPDFRLVGEADGTTSSVAPSGGAFSLVNDQSASRSITLTFTAFAEGAADRLTVRLPDGTVVQRTVDARGSTISLPVDVPPGVGTVTLELRDPAGAEADQVRYQDLATANVDVENLLADLP
jgi:hypothetical protein